jgi:CBS domain-containing protein
MKLNLKDHMTKKLITVDKDASVAEARRLMTNYWIRHLPVLDSGEDFIIGMLSERDVLKASSDDVCVEYLMTTPMRTFDIKTPLSDVVEAMIAEKISAFLITKGDEIVGITTSEDMLVLLNELLRKEESPTWSLSEVFTNPALQKAAYMVGQTGI